MKLWKRFTDWWNRDLIALEDEIERLNIALAACSVASMENTLDSVKNRLDKSNTYYTAAYQDVCNTVDREIQLRSRVEYLETCLGYRNDNVLRPQATDVHTS